MILFLFYNRLLCHAFSVLANLSLSSSNLFEELNEIILKATPLLGLNIPDVLQYQTKFFISCVVQDKESYNVCKVVIENHELQCTCISFEQLSFQANISIIKKNYIFIYSVLLLYMYTYM